ncbi:MAG: family 10 glycosylhydrolase [Fimbriimonadaceae bacterium]
MPLLSLLMVAQDITFKPPISRFERAYILKGANPITIDAHNDNQGVAQQMAKAKGLQGRMMWVDGTANLDRVASDELVRKLVSNIKQAGFNTIVFDVKPISGQVLYKSKIAPKIESWRGRNLPIDFDPLAAMVREAKAQRIELLVSLNAFSEGHALFKAGPGYASIPLQTVLYDPFPIVAAGPVQRGSKAYRRISATTNQAPADNEVSIYTDSSKLPKPSENLFALSLDKFGKVVDGYEFGGTGDGIPTIPDGGSILVGAGGANVLLRELARPGSKPYFDAAPNFVPISDRPALQYPLMMNPHHPEVQSRALAIIDEILTNYSVDGILYDDRLRYGGLNADFSPLARNLFEKFVGKPLVWPDDVFKYTYTPRLVKGILPGPYYDAWMSWRALQMRNWVARVRTKVKSVRKDAKFGVYAGSWYGEYPQFGSNYGSSELDAGFWFLTETYRKTGFANQLDLLVTGCYYPNATIFEAMGLGIPMGRTVEAAGQLSNRVARDQTWTYAGLSLDQFKNNPEGLANALQAACASTQGVMVFDYSHDVEPMLPVFAKAFGPAPLAPHQVNGLIEKVRARRVQWDKAGIRGTAVPIAAGSAGIGF